ncbi:LysR substrate-binding domain-containing protein [Tropicimonas sp. IMCC34011]|uniref:LysR substrate-binding domain-containing protein n=1 Tax=Tropicimonas sp. IMCC34011 TaxID=2248759 RepID=UPI0018E4F0E2|nr:LysR substrate-binding domain-containing protein [Tropicimonas sp. IMCC34011]
MRLTHRQLEAFRAVMETGSVTEAARQIHVTQPATSRLLADLEGTIGYALFKREKKRLVPTPEARALFEEVQRSYVGLETIAQSAREIGTHRRGSLHIVSLPAMAMNFLPRIIDRFCAERPDISVALHIASSQSVIASVATQQYDLGFSEADTRQRGVSAELLLQSALVAAIPKGHRLCDRKVLVPSDFEGEAFILTATNSSAGNRITSIFASENVKARTQISTQLSYAVGQFVVQGTGLALIDPITAAELQRQGQIEVRPFEPSLAYRYFVMSPTVRPRSGLSEVFLSLVREEVEALVTS